jgi:dephospho-CoA kinase
MSKIILGLTGLIASGKDVSKKYLGKKYGASSHRFSTMLRDILNRLYLPIDRNNLQNLSLDLRTRFGNDALARVIAEDVKNDPAEIVIVEGIRRLADIVTLKDLPNFYLVSVDAAPAIRHERLVKRNENVGDAAKTFAQFLTDEKREAELEIPTVMAQAKYHLGNNGTLEELYRQIDKIIAAIKKL